MGVTLNTLSAEDKFGAIPDRFKTIGEVTEALRKAGLESSNLVIGIDYTKSNLTQGKKTFGGRSLHDTRNEDRPNPYQKVIQIVGRTLSQFDEDNMIPAFGFGDVHTKGDGVFPFLPNPLQPRFCHGFEEVLKVYNAITPNIKLSGPTNYAPLINRAIEICMAGRRSEYHILVIIADGQVTNERETVQAIKKASNFPLSIVVVGVGDGPWDEMEYFDDRIKGRRFDNFQFVDYCGTVMKARKKGVDPDIAFSVNALMEIPDQFKCIKKLGLLGQETKNGNYKYALPIMRK